MSNEPVSQYKAITNTKIEPTVVSYTHPVKELEPKIRRACKKCIEQQAEIEALKAIVERLTADWTDGFINYEYNSDEPEENKLRDDVFAILRKAQEK